MTRAGCVECGTEPHQGGYSHCECECHTAHDPQGELIVDHYEYPWSTLIAEARRYAARGPSNAQGDYFIVCLADAVERMWGVMQRACNHPENWNEHLTAEMNRWRPGA